ncbi:GlsB/YeaQ/YmgE family stress response membrane protein, partial [Xanthomonas citri pv. citri]|nr:GlsB/YeaQ/YmgE family stress response membrane protein [Xanthomonas citri pv. citri]
NEKFFDLGTWIFAIIGGVIVAAVWQAITRRTGTRA